MPAAELLEKLGFSGVTAADPESFDRAIYLNDARLFVGHYKECTILSEPSLTEDFFVKENSWLEQKLIELLPVAEICIVSLHSGMNHWGYIVIKDGKRIRERLGDSDNGTTLDKGEPLEEEKELLAQSRLEKKGQRMYYLKYDPSEPYTEDQIGEQFVFEMFRRYTGEALDHNDDLMETSFEGFNVTWPKMNKAVSQPVNVAQTKTGTKPWWKFWQ